MSTNGFDAMIEAQCDGERRDAYLLLCEVQEILDDIPTSSLRPAEAERLYEIQEKTQELSADIDS